LLPDPDAVFGRDAALGTGEALGSRRKKDEDSAKQQKRAKKHSNEFAEDLQGTAAAFRPCAPA
ncbi:MAG: hypothetical protein KDB77_14205, partial [Flavobacteriales bacterium]|nr:hypothetical protein [Flavobacteriales bacterium]